MPTEMQRIINIIEAGARSAMTLEQIIKLEIDEWMASPERLLMLTGQRYYVGDADILGRKRMVVGEDGKLVEVENLANNRLVHNFVRKLVDQKVGYLLGLPLTVQTTNEEYQQLLNEIFDRSFMRLLKNLGKEAINKGNAWLLVYYDQDGRLSFKRMPSEEIIPLWRDAAHTELDAVIRVYEVETFEGVTKRIVTKVEFWNREGIRRYILENDLLIPDVEAGEFAPHVTLEQGDGSVQGYNWERVPFVCFKYNDEELPLVKFVKALVDDYDKHRSDNSNNLEDLPNSIYVLRNYDGTNLGEFRRNLSIYRAVKVSDDGGVDTINLNINVEAHKTHIEQLRKDIYEFGRGVDTQSERFGGDKSGVALKFLYADLDMDCNIIETEFQASLEQLRWFVDQHLANTTGKDYSNEQVDFIFNRDIIINEAEVIANAKSSVGIISDETIIANHPWVTNVQAELERIEAQRQRDMNAFESYQGFIGQDGNQAGEAE
jgi:SPP1 family phage portal protein